jgi:hypothetical protein
MVKDPSCKGLYRTNQTNFGKIPGSPIAYWASANLIHDFEVGKPLSEYVDPRQGLATTDNKKYLRQWFEISFPSIHFSAHSTEEALQSGAKWFPYNKGGAYRKWYGNYDYVVNWEHDGREIRNFKDEKGKVRSRPQNTDYYFREAITWSDIGSGELSVRYRSAGTIPGNKGSGVYSQHSEALITVLAVMNSKVGQYIIQIINPTITRNVGDIARAPILNIRNIDFEQLVKFNIEIAKRDWDSSEISWNFITNRIVSAIAEHNPLTIWLILLFTCLIRITSSPPSQTMAT